MNSMNERVDDATYLRMANQVLEDPRFEIFVRQNTDARDFLKHKHLGHADTELRTALDRKILSHRVAEPMTLLDVGGGDGDNLSEFLADRAPAFDCYNLDIEPSGDEKTIVFDVTKPVSDDLHNSFDVIYSFNALEHFCEPHIAADNIAKLLKPQGLCLVHTVFSWRYHPVPHDYFRFTDDGMNYLFSTRNRLTSILCGYDITRRRENIKGGYFEDKDIPPIDSLGGFRENWSVFYIGVKPAA